MNSFLKRFLQGLLLGFAFITTISGGTMAVIMGIYDELIASITNLTKTPKKSLAVIIPFGLGGVLSIGLLFFPIKLLLEHFPFPATAFFVGLTIGGLRVFNTLLKGRFTWKNLSFALIGFLFVAAMGAFSFFSTLETDLSNITSMQIVVLFFLAIALMAGSIAPGISGTFLLIALGYYQELIDFFVRIIKFEFVSVGLDLTAFFVFVLGALVGLFGVAKIFEFFFSKARTATNFTVLGFIVGSLVIAFFNGEIKADYVRFDYWQLIISVVTLVLGFFISSFFFKLAAKKENEKEMLNVEETNHVGI